MCDIKSSDCKCHRAVMAAYKGMIDDNNPESIAFSAAHRVYQFHHPEESIETSHLTVERWIHADRHH